MQKGNSDRMGNDRLFHLLRYKPETRRFRDYSNKNSSVIGTGLGIISECHKNIIVLYEPHNGD
jgi:hypothetical protein